MEVLGAGMNQIERLDHVDGKQRSYMAATMIGDLVFPCGQIPVDENGNTPASIAEQTELCLTNLSKSLEKAGSSLGSILQITVYLANIGDFEDYDVAYRKTFGNLPLPPRTTLFVQGFRGEKRIELTAIAAKEEREYIS
jgi:2-iminobutanoate/2-iminopropanoate deaminase